jgi:hypothetical protein
MFFLPFMIFNWKPILLILFLSALLTTFIRIKCNPDYDHVFNDFVFECFIWLIFVTFFVPPIPSVVPFLWCAFFILLCTSFFLHLTEPANKHMASKKV